MHPEDLWVPDTDLLYKWVEPGMLQLPAWAFAQTDFSIRSAKEIGVFAMLPPQVESTMKWEVYFQMLAVLPVKFKTKVKKKKKRRTR